MKKTLILILFTFSLVSTISQLNNPFIHSKVESLIKDSLKKKKLSTQNNTLDSSILLNTAKKILIIIKQRNYIQFASFIHPISGIRFSPYAYIDTKSKSMFFSKRFIQLAKQKKKINWGSAWDPEMEPELLTVDQYFKKFVYDVDFINAPIKSINEFHSNGTDLNNIKEVYPKCDVVEFFFSGFDKKYDGMDYRALRLVFKTYNKKPFLVAIVHDEWTP